MSILANFDIDVNFWQINPVFKVTGEFAKFYKKDTSKDKRASSKVMWAISLFADTSKENKLRNYSEKDRKVLISVDWIKDDAFKWGKFTHLVVAYREIELTPSKRSLLFLRQKLEEREMFLSTTTYTIENAKNLDDIIANTDKLFNLVSKLEALIEKEENADAGTVRGGRTESAGERKEI